MWESLKTTIGQRSPKHKVPNSSPSRSATPSGSENRLAFEALENRVMLSAERIVTIGDSWAWLVANGAPGSTVNQAGFSNSLQNVLNTYHPGVTAANESFMGGTAAQMATTLSSITDRVNAHPEADIVWLSIGGNDMLAGALAGGYTNLLSPEQKSALYATIKNNVQTVVNSILSIRPDIQIMIAGYDAINVWDLPNGTAANNLRANLGIVKSGNVLVDAQQNLTLNQGFLDLQANIVSIANQSSRVAFVDSWGLNHNVVGYSGYFGNFPAVGAFPPDFYPYLPTPTSRMNNGDAIHLNSAGYTNIALNAQVNFLGTALQAGQLGLSTTTLDFGQVRTGTAVSLGVTAMDVGPNYTKVSNLYFPVATNSFMGGNQSFNPLFKDPTLGSDTASVTYSFAPTANGVANQSLTVTSNSGSPTLNLSGQGVGPVASTVPNLSFGNVEYGNVANQSLVLGNTTADGNLGTLTHLTLLSASINGPDGSHFTLSGFTPGTVLSAGDSLALGVLFDGATGLLTNYNATLTIVTDQGAAFGTPGQTIEIPLSAVLVQAPPLTMLSGPVTALRGESVTFAIQGIEQPTSGVAPSFHYVINWGDGNTESVLEATGAVNRTHQYNAGGNYQVSVTTSDTAGTGQAATWSIDVFTYLLETDSQNPSLTNLRYGSTTGADTVTFTPDGDDGIIIHETMLNGSAVNNSYHVTAVTGHLFAYGSKGNDHFDASAMTSSVTLDGGAGNNTLLGGSGGDTLIGGSDGAEGDDGNNLIIAGDGVNTIYGNSVASRKGQTGGNNVIIGGSSDDTIYGNYDTNSDGDGGEGGQNVIVGGEGSDTIHTSQGVDGAEGGHGSIAITGTTSLEVSDLQAIQNEWKNPAHTVAVKVANIEGTGSSGLNGSSYLQSDVTVMDDDSIDHVFSDTHGDANWLFVSAIPDVVGRNKTADIITELI